MVPAAGELGGARMSARMTERVIGVVLWVAGLAMLGLFVGATPLAARVACELHPHRVYIAAHRACLPANVLWPAGPAR